MTLGLFELNKIYVGHCLELLQQLPDNSVHSCITSPPYYGLRDYGLPASYWPAISFLPMAGLPSITISEQECCLGLEKDIWAYVGHLVAVFREVKRVLRDDGTLWLNLGDSYTTGSGAVSQEAKEIDKKHATVGALLNGSQRRVGKIADIPGKNLLAIPWRVALALQADGYYLRSDIIWHKPNPMPESVTDRPTKAHEYIFLLSKSEHYYYDKEAIAEPYVRLWDEKNGGTLGEDGGSGWYDKSGQVVSGGRRNGKGRAVLPNPSGRNRRTVWTIATQSYPGAHFAVWPQKLIEPMILASTSQEGVCGQCGNPWVRQLEKQANYTKRQDRGQLNGQPAQVDSSGWEPATIKDLGFYPSCSCNASVVPALILDPFSGSGTTLQVAIKHRRRAIGFDLNPTYANELAPDRLNGTQIQML